MIIGIGHIALAVADIDETVAALCRAFSLPAPEIRDVPDRGMKVAVVQWGPIQMEIIEDYSGEGMLASHVARHGDSIHHFCVLSDDIHADVADLQRQGVDMSDRKPYVGLRGKRIAFVAPDLLNGIPIEISEP